MPRRRSPMIFGRPLPGPLPTTPVVIRPAMSQKRELSWFGPGTDAGGYAGMNREFVFGLDSEFNIAWDVWRTIEDVPESALSRIQRWHRYRPTRPLHEVPKVYGMTPMPGMSHYPGYNIAYTMMETRRLHPMFVAHANEADEIWVPSSWNVQVFKESGVKKPIFRMPLGIDTDMYQPNGPSLESWRRELSSFVIMMVFGWSLRKGIDLIRAYFEAFTSRDDVSLLVCTRYMGSTEPEHKKVVIDYFEKEIYGKLKNPDPPHCALFLNIADPATLPSLYRLAHVNWCMTRGEGWDRPAMEAGATGQVVIRPDHGAYKDFIVDGETGVLIPIDGFSRVEGLEWITDYYKDQEFPTLGPRVFSNTVDVLRDVYRNYSRYQPLGEALRKRIVRDYRLPVVVEGVARRLRTLTRHQG